MAEKPSERKEGYQGAQPPSMDDVLRLLSQIFEEFKKQVVSREPQPLGSDALAAVEQFNDIATRLATKLKA